MIKIKRFVLGPLENNTYLITDPDNKKAVVIDPSAPSRELLSEIIENSLTLEAILLTHAHFDHIGGVNWLIREIGDQIMVALHKDDLDLWENGGGSKNFGFDLDIGHSPNKLLSDQELLTFSDIHLTVLYTPGHTSGHVTFHLPSNKTAFCGDLIFFHGVGRTDLSNGDECQLINSIRRKIFTLPKETLLFPGHGPETSVEEEMANNPFL